MNAWTGVVETQYGTIVLAEPDSSRAGNLDFDRYWEEKLDAFPGGIQISVPAQNGDVPTEVRVLDEPGPVEDGWEHVAEVGIHASGGRLQIYSWMADEDLAGEIDVPTEPLVARVHWAGLDRWLALVEAQEFEQASVASNVRVDLIPGVRSEVRALRTWPGWAPPVQESRGPNGLRRYRGLAVEEHRAGLEPSGRSFWSPYPTTDEGTVHSLWRNPEDGSMWAMGSGAGSNRFLQELSPEEADALESASYPQLHTYARDDQDRIWSADQMPLERAPALLFIKPEQWRYLEALFQGPAHGVLGYQVVDLPPGWSRITRRPLDGSSPAVLVDDIAGDGSDGFYQRWPDGAEIPW